MTNPEEGTVTAQTVELMQAELRSLREQMGKMEQWIFMLEVDATEMELRLMRQVEGTLS